MSIRASFTICFVAASASAGLLALAGVKESWGVPFVVLGVLIFFGAFSDDD